LDRASKLFFCQEQGYSVAEAPGRGPERPASSSGNTIGPPVVILFPLMVFPRNALTAPGPKACFFAEMKKTKVKGQALLILLAIIDHSPDDRSLDSFPGERIRWFAKTHD